MSGVKGQKSGGHNKKPTELKKLTGTLRDHRTNKREPAKVKVGAPKPPEWLGDVARFHYHRLAKLVEKAGVMSEVDGDMLAQAAQSLVEYIEAVEEVASSGLVVTQYTETVMKDGKIRRFETTKLNPAATARSDAWRRYYSSLREFGLTPASRGGVSVLDAENNTPPDEAASFFEDTGKADSTQTN